MLNFRIIVNTRANEVANQMVNTMKKVEVDELAKAPAAQRRFGLIVIGDEILSGRRQDKHMS